MAGYGGSDARVHCDCACCGATIFVVAVVLEIFFSCSREVLVHDQDSETSMG